VFGVTAPALSTSISERKALAVAESRRSETLPVTKNGENGDSGLAMSQMGSMQVQILPARVNNERKWDDSFIGR
jgi:hypothetical protein